MLTEFLAAHTARDEYSRTQLKRLWRAYRQFQDDRGLVVLSRSRFVAELANHGYQVGMGEDKTLQVAGLKLCQRWTVVDGRMIAA